MNKLKLVIVGHVDHGKSTLVGRLLHETGALPRGQKTGCPVIVNTSFNVRGEPIVGSPEDAFRCFMGTEIESLALGNCFLRKEHQNPALKQNYEPGSSSTKAPAMEHVELAPPRIERAEVGT